MVSKKSQANPIFRTFFEPITKKIPVIRKCPIFGLLESNVTFDRKMLMVLPNGVYKLTVNTFSSDDENILTTAFTLKLNN